MSDGLHHLHSRKRLHKNLEQYPHPDAFKHFVDKLVYFVGIVGPLMLGPQVYKIWSTKDASSISLLSFSVFILVNITWFTYGFVHKEKALVMTYTLWAIMNSLVVIGTILYG